MNQTFFLKQSKRYVVLTSLGRISSRSRGPWTAGTTRQEQKKEARDKAERRQRLYWRMVKLQELNKKTDQRICSCFFLALTLVFASSYAVSLHYAAAGFVLRKKKEHYYSVSSFLVYLLVAFNIITDRDCGDYICGVCMYSKEDLFPYQ